MLRLFPLFSMSSRRHWRQLVLAGLCSALLASCGGNDDLETVVPVPASVAVELPTQRQALGVSFQLRSSAGDATEGLRYQWDFGDGKTSALASPQHSYDAAGVYTVKLVVSNVAGESVTGTGTVQVGDLAIVAGRNCSGADQSGWCWQRPLPQGQQLLAFHFPSDLRGWAVGEGGTIMATADGGKSWQAQTSGTRLAINRVYFVDNSVGWAAGYYGEMLRTIDGGANWQRFSTAQPYTVTALGAVDASVAWFGANGSTYLTTNAGQTWRRLELPGSYGTIAVAGASAFWGISNGMLWRSSDAKDWTLATQPPAGDARLTRNIDSVQALDARVALVTGYEYGYLGSGFSQYVSRRVFWFTADGGGTWQSLSAVSDYYPFYDNVRLLPDGAILLPAGYLASEARISTDRGQTWSSLGKPALAEFAYVVQMDVFSARRLMVRDSTGLQHFSSDGGASWLQGKPGGPIGAGMNSVWFFNSREGLAISNEGYYLKTRDGGLNWTQADGQANQGWSRLQFLPGSDTGWVISNHGAIFKSTDRGATWLSPVQPTSAPMSGVTDFHFVDAQNGWAVAPYSYSTGSARSGSIYVSQDGGSSWQPMPSTQDLNGLSSIRFADANHGVAVGPSGFAYASTDGGKTWTPKPTGTDRSLTRVTFANAHVALAVGQSGVILRSTDRGQSWSRVSSPTANTLLDVRFMSSTRGYAVGEGGTLITTNDGGLSWTVRDTGISSSLRSVFFVDAYTGWVVGDSGTILVTTDGG